MTSRNPTKTNTIEKVWIRDIGRRWAEYKKSTIELLRTTNKSLVTNRATPFELDPSQVRIYMTFVEQQIRRLMLGSEQSPNWQSQYQLQSYQRALDATRNQLSSQGADIVRTQDEIAAGLTLRPMTATPSLGIGSISGQPIHQDALQFLFTRSYDSLKGWTDALARETRQILIDGIEQGKGIREVTKSLTDRIDVSRSRAELIARTETIQAYQRGSVNEAKRLSEELGEEIQMRWITSRDDRVRHLHASWHGTLSTPEETFRKIQVSPWNCRCAQVATLEDSITPKKQEKFRKERQALMAIQRR